MTTKALLPVIPLLIAGLAAACDSTGQDGATTGDPPNTTASGLPCDVAMLLEAKCTSCHSSPPTAGAPISLVTYDDLTAPSIIDPSKTYAERSIVRMSASYAPMPPGMGGTADDIAVLQKWVDAGMPKGSCEPNVMPDPAFAGESTCTSGVVSKQGEDTPNKHDMYPGRACNQCHAKGDHGDSLPIFDAAGTVYPTGHEPNDCLGIDGTALTDVVVEITGADGQVFQQHPRQSGNFSFQNINLVLPYTAKITSSKGERVMSEPQTDGDCNLCHTDAGTSYMGSGVAPGRIVIP